MRYMLDPPSPVGFGVPSDPAVMTPSQRRREVAAILTRGVLRLRQCRDNLLMAGSTAFSGKPAAGECPLQIKAPCRPVEVQ